MHGYRFTNSADAPRASIYIYETIGEDFFGEGYSAARVVEDLASCEGKPVDVHINSSGGDVFDAYAICTALNSYTGETVAYVDGLAASAASYIACACDKVVMAKHALLMIHRASGACRGNCADMRAMADTLEQIDEQICGIYCDNRSLERDQVIAWMDDETWFSAEDALACGFVDEVDGAEEQPQMCVDADLFSTYRNAPVGRLLYVMTEVPKVCVNRNAPAIYVKHDAPTPRADEHVKAADVADDAAGALSRARARALGLFIVGAAK